MDTRNIPAVQRRSTVLALLAAAVLWVLAFVPTPVAAQSSVTVLSPVGGETWTGGVAHDVVWTLDTVTNNNVDVEYLVNGTPTLIESRTFLLGGTYVRTSGTSRSGRA
jgi:hypothetical protein